jgi:hypothetical protein
MRRRLGTEDSFTLPAKRSLNLTSLPLMSCGVWPEHVCQPYRRRRPAERSGSLWTARGCTHSTALAVGSRALMDRS